MTTGRPWVTWKLATTLDGRSAAADGTSQWITGEAARADVHEQRSRCGAVLVGTGTALLDDPQLTARRPDGSLYPEQPIRVVMGERDLPADARGSSTTRHPRGSCGPATPRTSCRRCAEAEVHHVWLEGGPTVAAAFMAADLVDEVVAYVAPVLLGARPPVGQRPRHHHRSTTRCACSRTDITLIGDDVRITASLKETR